MRVMRIDVMPMVKEFLGPLTGRLIHRVMLHVDERETEGTFVFAGYIFSFALDDGVLSIWMVT